ncbi:MAG: LemA family protein [Candidatus Taylorbacteria bacterium]|nr:LemA family protein [Candidatus Taylorbacteria bacterium]
MKKSTIIIIAVVVIVLGYVGLTYNGLVTANTSVDAQWAQVETQYQRRFDLIPNLVEAVKGIMAQEQEVFGMIADARTRYAGAGSTDEKVRAASDLETGLARLLVVMENYPQLQSAQNVQALQAQIEGTENRIATERGRFNDEVRSYNLKVSRFPSKLVASTFGFDAKEYFQSVDQAAEAPKVEF